MVRSSFLRLIAHRAFSSHRLFTRHFFHEPIPRARSPLQPAYHSAFNADADAAQVCGLSMLPLKTRVRGPAPCIDVTSAGEDAIDEALRLFRANVL